MTWRNFHRPEDDIKPVKTGLEALSARLGTGPTDSLSSVLGAWNDLVGEQVASHATPAAIRKSTLVVQVDESRWATQLKWMSQQILDKVNSKIPGAGIDSVEIKLTKPGGSAK